MGQNLVQAGLQASVPVVQQVEVEDHCKDNKVVDGDGHVDGQPSDHAGVAGEEKIDDAVHRGHIQEQHQSCPKPNIEQSSRLLPVEDNAKTVEVVVEDFQPDQVAVVLLGVDPVGNHVREENGDVADQMEVNHHIIDSELGAGVTLEESEGQDRRIGDKQGEVVDKERYAGTCGSFGGVGAEDSG